MLPKKRLVIFAAQSYSTLNCSPLSGSSLGGSAHMKNIPARPPLHGLRRQLRENRGQPKRLPKDGFVRQTFALPRAEAREKAQEWFKAFPKSAYWTEIESWCEMPDDVIQFTIRHLPTAD